jgi:hypothetical protein
VKSRTELLLTISAAIASLATCQRHGCWECLTQSERIRTALDQLDQQQQPPAAASDQWQKPPTIPQDAPPAKR